MLTKFKNSLDRFSIAADSTFLIACSGGLDSTVLVHLFKQLEYKFAIAHCNFSLRGKESDADEDFVMSLAKSLEIPFYKKSFHTDKYAKTNRLSTQMAARELRYRWFSELNQEEGYNFVLTGHHLDDSLETFFINLSRGTGLRGLNGIPFQNGQIIRPLLDFSRQEIFEYAKKNEIYWREDSSNAKKEYLRNLIRHDLSPQFKKLNEHGLTNFQQTQKNLRASEALIDDYLVLVSQMVVSEGTEGYEIDIEKLNQLPNTDALIYELLFDYGFRSWKDILDLLRAQSGKQVLSSSHRIVKDRDRLLLTKLNSNQNQEVFIMSETSEISTPINLKFSKVSRFEVTNANSIFLDESLLKFPLKLRKWTHGDVFHPFGMSGKKKLSKFFKDEKLSLVAKEKTWLLCSDDEIVWVVGQRADERYKVTRETEIILRIDYTPE